MTNNFGVKMSTKHIFLALAAFVALSGLAGAQSASYGGALSMVNVSVSPNPVVAGGNMTIRFQLYNSYGYWIYGTTLQPSGSFPLLNASPLGSRVIGQMGIGGSPQYYSYTLSVPNTTPSGTYTVTFTATYFLYAATGTVIATSEMPVSFYVQNKPSIKIVASSPQPPTLYTGHNQTLTLLVENNGYGDARNTSVSLRGVGNLSILSSVTTFFVSNLTQGSSTSEPLLVASQGLSQNYLLANVTYYSSNFKQRFSSVQRINLSVAPSAQFTIGSMGLGPSVGATDVPMHFIITNTGTSVARALQLGLETTYPITPVASTAYVASLQPGESANLTFLVNVDTAGVPGNYPVTLYEQWKQPNGAPNQQFSGSDNYFVPVAAVGAGTYIWAEAILAAVVIIAAVMAFRRMAGKKMKKKG